MYSLNMRSLQKSKGLQSDYCRCRHGSTSSGNVRSDLPDAGYRNSQCHTTSSGRTSIPSTPSYRCRSGIPVATVAINGGANAGTSGSKDSGNLRPRASAASEGLFRRAERARWRQRQKSLQKSDTKNTYQANDKHTDDQ